MGKRDDSNFFTQSCGCTLLLFLFVIPVVLLLLLVIVFGIVIPLIALT